MSDAPANPIRRRWMWKAAIAIALGALVAIGWSRLLLTAHFASAVGEEYPGEFTVPNAIHADHFERICRWPPTQVATYLKAPWAKWRALACQTLTEGQWPADAPWTGVGIELSRVALTDPQLAVRGLAFASLKRALPLVPNEIPQIVQIAAASESDDRYRLLLAIAKLPAAGPSAHELMLSYRSSDRFDDRLTSWLALTDIAPGDLTTEHLRNVLSTANDSQTRDLVIGLHQVRESRPDLIEALFDGSAAEQLIAIQAMGLALWQPTMTGIPAPLPELSATEQRLLARAVTVCEPLLLAASGNALYSVIAIAARSSEGGHWLAKAAAKATTPQARLQLLDGLFGFLWTRVSRERFQFTAEEAEMLVGLLSDEDTKIKWKTLQVIVFHQYNDLGSARERFPEGSGPRNPANRERFHRVLSEADPTLVSLALQYFYAFGPIGEQEIPSIVAGLRRGPRNSLQFIRVFVEIAKRYPDHNEVRQLRRELEESDSPSDNMALSYLARALATDSTDQKGPSAPAGIP